MLVWITTGMFVFARLAGLLLTLPVVSTQGVPRHVNIMGAMALTLVMVPVVPAAPGAPTLAFLVMGMMGDVVLGLLLGLIVNAIFISFTIASEVMAMQMGFAMAALFDPVLKAMDGPIGVLGNWLAGMVFLGMGLHLTCIGILADSFALLPPGRVPGVFGAIDILLDAMAHTIVMGMQLAGPVLALVWLVQVFVMVLTKIAPRMNIYFSVGMILVNGAGLMLLGLSLPYLLKTHGEAMHYATELLTQAVQAIL
jgi:flagellar biosynthetic protein FliR